MISPTYTTYVNLTVSPKTGVTVSGITSTVTQVTATSFLTGAPGKTAYQVALANGFVGTETQWLASLKGAPGDPATNLVTSVAGKQGVVTLTKSDVGLSNVPNTDFTSSVAGKQDTLVSGTNIKTVNGTTLLGSGDIVISGGGGGSGTVTSVSVTTANGVSGSVATSTTTPAISLTLGAITPTSVAASGTVTGSNLSGTNTGDQNLTPYALIASPTFTGVPAAPTATVGTSTTQLATTKFVMDNDLLDAHLAGTETFTGAKTFSSTITGSVSGNAGTATTLATARTIGTLTGDVTTAGSTFNGSANNTNATTLATVNSNVGTFGSASSVSVQTVNAKGLTTAASSVAIAIAQSQVTNLVSDLAAKQGTLTLTTTGTSGASTLVGNTLNIPQYSGGGGGMTNPMTAVGDVIQGGTAGAPARLASVATGNALISGGVTTANSWGKIGLTTHVSGTLPVANGGTNATTTQGAINATNPHSTLGDISYRDSTNVTRLAGNITTTKQYLTQTGTGTVSAAPAWSALAKADVGLSNVDNTADTAKPVSTAQATAIATKVDNTKIAANGMGVAVHGATAGTARPTGFAQITWIGTVAPTNAATNDIWYQG